MGRYNFVGSVDGITPQQLDFISEVLEKRGYKGTDVNIEPIGKAGDNYIADVRRIIVNENGKTFKMVAKIAPNNPMMRQMGNIQLPFSNEAIIYTQVLPKFRQLQISADIPKEEWFRFAECYGCNLEAPHEVILLEDLNEDNYEMLNRFKPLNTDCVKIVLKNLAIFHSLSFALRHQEPETYAEWAEKLRDMFVDGQAQIEMMRLYFKHMEDTTIGLLTDDRYKRMIKGTISDMDKHTMKLQKGEKNSKHSVIQQGDGWTNNILFQMQNETPLSCVLIDYQIAKASNPAYDIMYSVFNSTDYEQRKAHYHDFIDYYHTQFDKSLNNFGLKAAFLYPRDQLDADLKRYAKLMMSASIMISNVIIRKSEEAEKFKDAMAQEVLDISEEALNETNIKDQETITLFKKKIEGLVDSFLEFGLLQAL